MLGGKERLDYFVRKVADFEEVWGLMDEGWAMAMDASGRDAVPFWPEKEFADACATGSWSGFRPEAISLDDLVSRWLPGMKRDNRAAVVFPTAADKGTFVESDYLLQRLRQEAAQYE